MESGDHIIHQGSDAVVTQVADASFVGVVHFFVVCELSGFDIQSHFLVGITERHAFSCQTVDFFHAEHVEILVIVQDVFVDLDLVHDVGCHVQAVFQFLKCRKEHFLDDLQVAEITGRQVVHNHHDLLRKSLDLVAFGAGQLEYVRVFFMRHDAGAGGTFVREFDKSEVLTAEHAGVESHFGEGACDGSHGKCHVALHFSASHLA